MENDIELQEVIAHTKPRRDAVLKHFVLLANLGCGIDVTIVVDGQVIAGQLISGKEYCEEMYNSFVNVKNNRETGEVIGEYFLKLKDDVYTKENASEIPLNFLHLKKVGYLKGDGGFMNFNGALLRVSLDKVSAFSPGRPE